MAGTQQTPTPGDQLIPLTFDQLKELLKGSQLSKDEQLELIQKQADANAEANRRLLKPENATHPGMSVFSYPEGEQARPKGELHCKTTWAGTVLEASTLTTDELTLANAVPTGEYLCRRADGTNMKVIVSGETHPGTGQFVKKDIFFSTRGVLRHNLSSMVAMLQEMIAQAKVRASVAPPSR